ncbi:MAG TPA: metallophosphoesterase [Candidatus Dormibacteraeota bacterium]|jgi:Icc-related predicted phosphoesterase
MRIAAIGDVHYGVEEPGSLHAHLDELAREAEALLIAGDLTRHGDPAEARELAADLAQLEMPKFAVLGNHDYHSDQSEEIVRLLTDAGVQVLEGEAAVVAVNGARFGVAGAKGYGGGFPGGMVTAFGEPETKAFARHGIEAAERLSAALEELRESGPEHRVALLHYAPIEATLVGEHEQVWPFLGNYLLAEAVDRSGADLVLHGHAHRGSPSGSTPRGVPVRNVAQPVVNVPYVLIELNGKPLS